MAQYRPVRGQRPCSTMAARLAVSLSYVALGSYGHVSPHSARVPHVLYAQLFSLSFNLRLKLCVCVNISERTEILVMGHGRLRY
jgi:hypothetical protein